MTPVPYLELPSIGVEIILLSAALKADADDLYHRGFSFFSPEWIRGAGGCAAFSPLRSRSSHSFMNIPAHNQPAI